MASYSKELKYSITTRLITGETSASDLSKETGISITEKIRTGKEKNRTRDMKKRKSLSKNSNIASTKKKRRSDFGDN